VRRGGGEVEGLAPGDKRTRAGGDAPERGLPGSAHRARVVDIVAEIGSAVDSGENHAGPRLEHVGEGEDHAIGRSAIHREGGFVDLLDGEGALDGDPLAAGAAFAIGSHHHHVAQVGHGLAQGQQAGSAVAIVVGDQDQRSGHPFSLS
jgi:hypothetical protein